MGILGVAGIYDLVALRDSHSDVPAYQEFIENAFGPNEESWKDASPVYGDGPWRCASSRVVVVAHSQEDELIDSKQPRLMMSALEYRKVTKGALDCNPDDENYSQHQRKNCLLSLRGKHDDIWQDGQELATAISAALEMLAEASYDCVKSR
jgi:hypothetical protein